MPGNRPKPRIPEWDEYTEKNIVPYLTEAWRQQKSPKDALTEDVDRGDDDRRGQEHRGVEEFLAHPGHVLIHLASGHANAERPARANDELGGA